MQVTDEVRELYRQAKRLAAVREVLEKLPVRDEVKAEVAVALTVEAAKLEVPDDKAGVLERP
ncbi:MAG: hypothetical protein N3E40_00100 [Dehalococcoidia bacterium]|nr:hypothetical protein [Dehalococcoidia bacterium]